MLSTEINLQGQLSEGMEIDSFRVGPRDVQEEVGEQLRFLFDGVVQDDQDKILRIDTRIHREDFSDDDGDLRHHQVTVLTGIPAWDYLRDRWVMSGTDVLQEWLVDLRRCLALYDGQNATVFLSMRASIAEFDGMNMIPEFDDDASQATFTPMREPEPEPEPVVEETPKPKGRKKKKDA